MTLEKRAGYLPGNDPTVVSLIASNLVTMLFALIENWPIAITMMVYWAQSVIIGAFNVKRILGLNRFAVQGFTMNDRPVTETPTTKRSVAGFFALHYGFLHFVYLMFLLVAVPATDRHLWPVVLAGAALFAFNHWFSYQSNRQEDERGRPSIGTLMFLPYARILPMHLTLLAGGIVGGSSRWTIALFMSLKTVADVIMHIVEHRVLRRGE